MVSYWVVLGISRGYSSDELLNDVEAITMRVWHYLGGEVVANYGLVQSLVANPSSCPPPSFLQKEFCFVFNLFSSIFQG